jgi:tRNA-Thr(GGU) m(6)t(6)A37 methyltransferase TsaA
VSPEEAGQAPILLDPIAWVKNGVKDPGHHEWTQVESELVFNPGFDDALDGLDDFSHITVLFWMHRSPAWDITTSKIHPQRRTDLPLVGVLATHSPYRPNPLGMTIVRLLERRGNVLKVSGLDAIDGTPVVDIKPFFPGDEATEARVPDWVFQLRQYNRK